MKSDDTSIMRLFAGADKRFVIPIYQRNYDWTIDNCAQMFDDILKIHQQDLKSHFFGSLVYSVSAVTTTFEYLVIDGQQRLTTLVLLLTAMYHSVMDERLECSQKTKDMIFEQCLWSKYADPGEEIRLKPVVKDNEALKKIFKREPDPKSNLTTNYNYFVKRLMERKISIDDLFQALYKLNVIGISLEREDNPQLIFESLNSTGLDLTEADKVRNYLLMGLSPALQQKLYLEYWSPIEDLTDKNVSAFFRDFLSIETGSTPKQQNIYPIFKKYADQKYNTDENSEEVEELFKLLKEYAKYFEILNKGNTQNRRLNNSLSRLAYMDFTVIRPFMMEVLKLWHDHQLSDDEVAEVSELVESFLYRRAISSIPTNALNKIFLLLNRDVYKLEKNYDNYVEKLKYLLLNKKESSRMPDDKEFLSELTTRQLYIMNKRIVNYTLERFENFGTKETKDVVAHIENHDYSVEHVMPQKLNPEWEKSLGENWKEIHQNWVHRLANLTLTAYNSRYSNASFEDKKEMDNGFHSSGIRLNKWISEQPDWQEEQLVARSRLLAERAKEIWPYPESTYQPESKEKDWVFLSEDLSLTNSTITAFSFKNTEYPVSNWTKMFEEVVKLIYRSNPSWFYQQADSDEHGFYIFKKAPTEGINFSKIDKDLYVNVNTSTDQKQQLLRRLFDLLDIDQNELAFVLGNQTESKNDNYWLYEKRGEYKKQLAKKLTEENGWPIKDKDYNGVSNGLFNKTSNKGMSIGCITNSKQVGVYLFAEFKDKDRCRWMFDQLVKMLPEMEKQIGIQLKAHHNENSKYFNVGCTMEGVSIAKESDWDRMQNFQIEYSRKMNNVLPPMIEKILKEENM